MANTWGKTAGYETVKSIIGSNGLPSIDPTGTDGILQAINKGLYVPSGKGDVEINAAHARAVAMGGGNVVLEPFGTFTCSDTMAIDTTYGGVVGERGFINAYAAAAASKTLFRLTGTGTPYGNNVMTHFGGFRAVGDGTLGQSSPAVGHGEFMLLNGGTDTTGGPGPSRITWKRWAASQFNYGIRRAKNSYAQQVSNFELFWNDTGIIELDGQGDSGERCVFEHGMIYLNNNGAIHQGNQGTWTFYRSCSFDHNYNRAIQVRGLSHVTMERCHIEFNDMTTAPFQVDGAETILIVEGGQVVVTGDTTTRTLPYIVENNTSLGGGVYFNGVDFYKPKTANKAFATGTGKTYMNGHTIDSTHESFLVLSLTSHNELCDGGFENNIGDDLVSIYKSAADTTSALTFTGALSGATSATLNAATTLATGSYSVTFSDGSIRSVAFINGSTNVSWFGAVTGTTAATVTIPGIYDAYRSVNGSISYSTVAKRSGAKSLLATKTGAVADPFGFLIAVPIRNVRQRGKYLGYFNAPSGATFTVNPGYGKLLRSSTGAHTIKNSFQVSEAQQTKSGTAAFVVSQSAFAGVERPRNSDDYYIIAVDLTAAPAGAYYFDDFVISLM